MSAAEIAAICRQYAHSSGRTAFLAGLRLHGRRILFAEGRSAASSRLSLRGVPHLTLLKLVDRPFSTAAPRVTRDASSASSDGGLAAALDAPSNIHAAPLLMSAHELMHSAHSIANTLREVEQAERAKQSASDASAHAALRTQAVAAAKELMCAELDAPSFHVLLRAYTQLQRPDEEFLAAVHAPVAQRVPDCTFNQLAVCAEAFSRSAALHAHTRLLAAVAERAAELLETPGSRVPWSMDDILSLLTAFGRARMRPTRLLHAACDRLTERMYAATRGSAADQAGAQGQSGASVQSARSMPAHRARNVASRLSDALVRFGFVHRPLVDALCRVAGRSVRTSAAGIARSRVAAVAVRRQLVTDASALAYNLTLLGALPRHAAVVQDCIRTAVVVGNTTGSACVRGLERLLSWMDARDGRAAKGPQLDRAFDGMFTARDGEWTLSPGDHPANLTRVYRSMLGIAAHTPSRATSGAKGEAQDLVAAVTASGLLPEGLIVALRRGFIRTVTAPGSSIVSDTQRVVAKRLAHVAAEAGYPAPQSEFVTASGLVVDVALPFSGSTAVPTTPGSLVEQAQRAGYAGIAVEVDGPCHYTPSDAGAVPALEDGQEHAAAHSAMQTLYDSASAAPTASDTAVAIPESVQTNLTTLFTRWILQRSGWIVVPISLQDVNRHIHAQPNARVDAFLATRLQQALRHATSS